MQQYGVVGYYFGSQAVARDPKGLPGLPTGCGDLPMLESKRKKKHGLGLANDALHVGALGADDASRHLARADTTAMLWGRERTLSDSNIWGRLSSKSTPTAPAAEKHTCSCSDCTD